MEKQKKAQRKAVYIPPELMEQVDEFKEKNYLTSDNQGILQLLIKGLQNDKDKETK